jgi:hypothetical protein
MLRRDDDISPFKSELLPENHQPRQYREIAMRILAAIMGTAVALSPALHANAQFTGPKVADAKPGDVRVIATAAIREPLNAVLKQAEAAIDKPIP